MLSTGVHRCEQSRAGKLNTDGIATSNGFSMEGGDGAAGPCNALEASLNRVQLNIALGNCTLAIRELERILKALWIRDAGGRSAHIENSLSTLSPAETDNTVQANDFLANKLYSSCFQWRIALRIAVKDFLYALHTFPCFVEYGFFPLFGPELIRLQEEETRTAFDVDEREVDQDLHNTVDSDGTSTYTNRNKLNILPPPIDDVSFFNFERDFNHWIIVEEGVDENADGDEESQAAIRASKHEQWKRPYANDIQEALWYIRQRDFDAAARRLLSAHYKTSFDSHDEYLLLIWRVQVFKHQGYANQCHDSNTGLTKAVSLLRDFLYERRSPQEIQFDASKNGATVMKGGRGKAGQLVSRFDMDENDDDASARSLWIAQRHTIRADLYTYLGNLHQLSGNLEDAQKSFIHALSMRPDHTIALLNHLQLCIIWGDYEVALDVMISLLEMFLNHSDGSTLSSSFKRCGLLNADRSTIKIVPSIVNAFDDLALFNMATQMVSLLKEYRGLLSTQIQSSASQVYRKQGAIAQLIHKIKSFLAAKTNEVAHFGAKSAQASVDVPSTDHTELSGDQLSAFNQTLDCYQEKLMKSSSIAENDEDEDFRLFYDNFQCEFASLCQDVAATLPVLVSNDGQQKASQDEVHEGRMENRMEKSSEESTSTFLAGTKPRKDFLSRQRTARRRPTPVMEREGLIRIPQSPLFGIHAPVIRQHSTIRKTLHQPQPPSPRTTAASKPKRRSVI